MLEAGVRDILYGVGIAPNKFKAVAALCEAGADMIVLVDSIPAATSLSEFFHNRANKPRVFIEIDTDDHRAGLSPDSPELLTVAKALEPLDVAGVMTHAGESYLSKDPDEVERYAALEADGASRAAQRLREAGYAASTVSIGSSPTSWFAKPSKLVNEYRAGVYALGDLFMANLGVVGRDDIAMSCLVTVTGHQPDRNWIITDGGWTAISQDRSTSNQPVDWFFGEVCDIAGEPIEGLLVVKANQEHGILSTRDGAPVPEIPWGTRLRIRPNHACAMADHHSKVFAQSETDIFEWPRAQGWAPRSS